MTEPRVYWVEVCRSCGSQIDEYCWWCMYKTESGGSDELPTVSKAVYDKLWHKFAAAMPLTDYAPPAAKSMLDKTFHEIDNESTQ